MPTEWIDKEVQGRRRLCFVVDEPEWESIANALVEFWQRFLAEADAFNWSAMYISIQPDYGFNFYLHSEPAAEQPSGPMLDCPRFELEILRMETDFLDKPDEEHPALRESAWQALEQGLVSTQVLPLYEALQDAGRLIRGGEWDAKNGFPRRLNPRQ